MGASHPGSNDEGFSAVLGAMVLLGIALIAFTTYQTTLAPSLEARTEADQMDEAADRLREWSARAGLADPQAGTGQARILLPAEPAGPPFARSPASSTVSFAPGTDSVSIATGSLSVSHRNGTAVDGTDEAWHPVEGEIIDEVVGVDGFRLRIDEIDSDRRGENVTVHVRDDVGNRVGDLRVSVRSPGGGNGQGGQGYELVVRTRDANGTVLYDQPILISSTTHDSHSDPISPYWVNLLNEDYRFDRVLSSADRPFTIDLAKEGLDADYTIEYAHASSPKAASSGVVHDRYDRSSSSGRLSFQARADQAADQRLTVEHGALVRSQSDGDVFAREPAFSATTISHTVHVAFTWPTLTGSPDARSAQDGLSVHGEATATYGLRGEATNLTVNVTTDRPELWRSTFDERLQEAGLSPDRGFTTATGAGWARVDVWGLLDPDPGSERYDVSLELTSVTIDVRIRG